MLFRSGFSVLLVLMSCGVGAAQSPSLSQAKRSFRGVPVASPLRIDGRLEEEFYRTVAPMSDFVQIEPVDGAVATEKTDVWVAFDDTQIYIAFRCWDSHPELRVAKEMRRDNVNIWSGDDNVAFILDTFFDRRNSFQFTINSIGGRQDAQVFNERQWVGDWNTIWSSATGRFDGGWTAEAAIPFKSLRYQPGREQTWGFNAMRTSRWKNEISFLVPMPKAQGQRALLQASLALPLEGLRVPDGSRNVEIKPYAIANARQDRVGHVLQGDLGVDAKYGVTQNLTADFTYNTDFAQAEADQQQINLTRFSLFFPEKREFFLEGQGIFNFGTTAQNAGGDVPILFYSRRIGLDRGAVVPVAGGGRLTGRVGRFTLGAIDIQGRRERSLEVEPTNFSVVRLRRDILRRSSVGAMATGRSALVDRSGSNSTVGVDGIFAFYDNLGINTYWARSSSGGRQDTSYRGQFDYAGDRYGLQAERLVVGRDFDPGIGYVQRPDMRRSSANARFSPRPRRNALVRKYTFYGSIDYVENTRGLLETRSRTAKFQTELQNADWFAVTYYNQFERLPRPFSIRPGVTLPVGGYAFDNVRAEYTTSTRRRLAGTVSLERGTFYNGRRTAVGGSGARVNLGPRLSLEPSYAVNGIDLEQGSFTTHLAGTRATFTPTPFMFLSALLQYNSSTHNASANVRFRWEYQPGSELFVVLNDDRDTRAPGFPQLNTRAFIVKVNRLLRF